jgi:autoinducer 2-degrading protein
MASSLHIALVNAHVRPERVEDFQEATRLNASESRKEAGVVRFDVVQELEDPSRFVLIEVFRSPAAAAAHRETAHYLRWRDAVAEMMAEPRASKKYLNVSPDDAGW